MRQMSKKNVFVLFYNNGNGIDYTNYNKNTVTEIFALDTDFDK